MQKKMNQRENSPSFSKEDKQIAIILYNVLKNNPYPSSDSVLWSLIEYWAKDIIIRTIDL
jgi:hypothetical protein